MVAENLHRAELNPIQEAEFLKKWERLLRKRTKAVQVALPGGRQPHDKGITKVAKALGMSREKVRRLRVIGNISAKAMAAAEKAGLGRNRKALIKVGKEKTPNKQLQKVRELSELGSVTRPRGEWLVKRQLKRLTRELNAASGFKKE